MQRRIARRRRVRGASSDTNNLRAGPAFPAPGRAETSTPTARARAMREREWSSCDGRWKGAFGQSADRVNGAVSAMRAPAQEWRGVYRVKFCDVERIAHFE